MRRDRRRPVLVRVRAALLLAWVAAGALAWTPRAARAQEAAGDPLAGLAAATRQALGALLDSARTARLPLATLQAKIAEGVSKGAEDEQIVRAVRELSGALSQARGALGAAASDAELVAGGGALQAGVSAGELRRLRTSAGTRSLATALVVLGDFVRRGVPKGPGLDAIAELLGTGATDEKFSDLRARVARDISTGVAAATALTARLKQVNSEPGPRAVPAAVPTGPPNPVPPEVEP
ncbi:MAG: hypothetical protein HYX65_07335 [Gemmatimonadetes bacterium]|nr:hypothetical protein [Gemmatimonadota bacterium]